MKNFFYTIAKAIVENREKKDQTSKEKAEKIRLQEIEDKKEHDKLIKSFREKYIGELSEEFKKTNLPEFNIGDKALTHWYGESDYWDGSVSSLQSHTPFRGPIEVEITGVFLDTSEISERLDQMNERELFNDLVSEHDYPEYKTIVDSRRATYTLKSLVPHWSYTLQVPGDENKYWNYTWRENKLLNPKSEEAKWSKKAFKNEQEYKRLREEAEALREKIKRQVEKANYIKVLSR